MTPNDVILHQQKEILALKRRVRELERRMDEAQTEIEIEHGRVVVRADKPVIWVKA